MEHLRKLEIIVTGWFKDLPRLPKEVTSWIAHNIWWIVAVLAILGALGVIGAIGVTFFAGALLTIAAGPIGAVVGGVAMIVVLISFALTVISLVIAGLAIKPLKLMQKRGWELLFLLIVIEVASLVLSLVFNFAGALWGLIWAALGAYILFEIKSYFGSSDRIKKKNEAPNK